MLRILEHQMARLGQRTRRRFLGMMEAYLRAHFAAWLAPVPDDQLRAFLHQALAKAERYGVTTEPEAAQLILLFLVLGEDADERDPWVAEALSARHLAPLGKIKKLVAVCREHEVPGLDHVLVYEGMEA
jgi:hypothetical protein